MKNNFILFLCTAFLLFLSAKVFAQDSIRTQPNLVKIEPYRMEITYDKTTHLIFPAAIRYVDLGSDYLIAGKAEDAENVLRVKSSVKGFEPQTNFSVITDDGRFYSFNIYYSPYPESSSYDLSHNKKPTEKTNINDVLFDELGTDSPSLSGLILETIYKQDKRAVKHIASRSFGITFSLKSIYIHNGKYYFHTVIENKTNVPFPIDFINFKIVDKKLAKRTVVQEKIRLPLRTYKPLTSAPGKATERNVFLLDQFTIGDDKVLQIEVFEKNGGRHQVLKIENSDLVRARLINDIHLKF